MLRDARARRGSLLDRSCWWPHWMMARPRQSGGREKTGCGLMKCLQCPQSWNLRALSARCGLVVDGQISHLRLSGKSTSACMNLFDLGAEAAWLAGRVRTGT